MIEVTRFTLPNGLRVVHSYDPPSAMVALNLVYNVGSRDESPELTGMAHLFEHLMFGGSVNVPAFDTAMERAGGINNAWTSNDFTNFYDVAPAVNAETLFWLESDRMLGLAFSEKSLEVQRSVVIEEFKQTCLNKPYGDRWHHLRRLCYSNHPYSYPTIGREIYHLRRVTMEDVRRFFYSHYAPGNAVLAVTGAITAEETRRLAEKWFSSIPSREVAPRTYGAPAPLDGPVRETVTGEVPQTLLTIAYRMGGYGAPDYIPCDIITDILASGRASRFYRNLLMGTDLFTDVNASILGCEEPGLLIISGRMRDNSDATLAAGESAILQQLDLLTREPVSEHELLRAVNRFESQNRFNAINFLNKAEMIAMAEMHGEDVNSIVPAYRAVTTDDIMNVAASTLRSSNSATLIYRPA